MKAIWKFQLGREIIVSKRMPKGAKILSVQGQFREGAIWALVEVNAEPEDRIFVSLLTGEEFELTDKHIYLGTYQIDSGNHIVHVFEIIK